jgi:pimeloyl-ACP methyl ester carboxylesterase
MNSPLTAEKTVNFIQQGQGAPVILIHGLAASLFDWNDLIPELVQAGYAAYALDLLGHGKSVQPRNLEEYCLQNVFEHFEGWLQTLAFGHQPLTLVGHSLGGYLAMEYALRYPQRVRALVLVDPFYTLEQLPPLLRLRYKGPLISTRMIEATPEWVFRVAIDLTSLTIRNGYALSAEVRAQTARDYKRANPAIFNIPSTIRDLLPCAPQINAPTLLVWGARDQTLNPTFFTKLAAALPDVRTYTLPAGHVPHQSHPAEFNRPVLEFLRTLDNG